MTTIREIAEKAGYSPATVSRLLNHDPTFSISDAAREKILKVARNLNYFQQNAIKGTVYKIAIIFSVQPQKELEDVYFSNLRESLLSAGQKAEMTINFYHEVNEVPKETDGYIAVGYFTQSQISALQQLHITGIFVDSNPDPATFTSVQPNLEAITQHAIDLFRKASFEQIGFIGGKYWDAEN